MSEYSVSPTGENFAIPEQNEYEAEFKHIELLVEAARSEGKEIVDVDTKESLGKAEIIIATIEVGQVTPKISYARLIKGDASTITEGLVCRRKKDQDKPLEGFKSNIERTPAGGVKMPFD